jgi:sulfite exporter TauE/SafE
MGRMLGYYLIGSLKGKIGKLTSSLNSSVSIRFVNEAVKA